MENVLRNQKDNLAKLMASEDISIQHKKVRTASFDVKNRVLTCPIFKDDLSSELYDLFMGHEVSHALNTPYEGLHSTLLDNPVLKDYLNVIEDVRIERMIKDKFPGLRKSFFKAYAELMEKNFFGISGKDPMSLGAVDKINLYAKVGVRSGVVLNKEEQEFYDRAFAAKTWEEVVKVATDLYNYSKINEVPDEEEPISFTNMDDLDFGDDDFDEDDFDQSPSSSPTSNVTEDESSTPSDEELDSGSGAEGQGDLDDNLPDVDDLQQKEPMDNPSNDPKDQNKPVEVPVSSNEGGYQSQARKSITERAAHNNEDLFYAGDEIYDRHYAKWEDNTKSVIDPARIVDFKQIKEIFDDKFDKIIKNAEGGEYGEAAVKHEHKKKAVFDQLANVAWKKIIDRNKKVVNNMAKDFEMKKSAMLSKRTQSSKTGRIDLTKLAKYQISEDIFQRMSYTPEGKNHGLVVFLDHSGSIANMLCDLIEQSIVLAMFCKKVGIPFKILSFSDSINRGGDEYETDFGLIEWLSSDMKKNTFEQAGKLFMTLYNEYNLRYGWYNSNSYKAFSEFYGDIWDWENGENWDSFSPYMICSYCFPYELQLGGTPLDKAVIWARHNIPAIQKSWGVDIMNTTWVTDGYSHSSHCINNIGWRTDTYFTDPISKKNYPYEVKSDRYRNSFDITQNLLEWFKAETGSRVTGYFLLSKKADYHSLKEAIKTTGYTSWHEASEEWKEVRTKGIALPCKGYGTLLVAQGKVLEVSGDDELDESLEGASRAKLTTAFKKNAKQKQTSRYLMSKFIEEIA